MITPVLLAFLGTAIAAEKNHDALAVLPSRPEAKIPAPPSSDYTGEVRAAGYSFQYLDVNSNWSAPDEVFAALEDGEKTQPDGSKLPYKQRDIVYRLGNTWYKSHEPELLVPNPHNVPLTVSQRYVIHYSNVFRQKNGRSILRVSSILDSVVNEHAQWMATTRKMIHIGKNGPSPAKIPAPYLLETSRWDKKTQRQSSKPGLDLPTTEIIFSIPA